MKTKPLFKGLPGEWNWHEFEAACRKEIAIEKIKCQPFFRPRDGFYKDGK